MMNTDQSTSTFYAKETMKLGICDLETTGLYPHAGHEPWEVGLLLVDDGEIERYQWQLPVDLGRADPMALTVGRFYERRRPSQELTTVAMFVDEFAEITHGVSLIGAVPSFDERHLIRLMIDNNACPGWHYQIVDVETLAVGWLRGQAHAHTFMRSAHARDLAELAGQFVTQPWDSNKLSEAVGVDPEQFDRHTAIGDCEWAWAIYQKVMRDGGH